MNYFSRKRKTNNAGSDYTRLESRNLLAGISIESIAGRPTLLIDGGSDDDVALVADANAAEVQVLLNGESETFNKSDFERIRFLGRSGTISFLMGPILIRRPLATVETTS